MNLIVSVFLLHYFHRRISRAIIFAFFPSYSWQQCKVCKVTRVSYLENLACILVVCLIEAAKKKMQQKCVFSVRLQAFMCVDSKLNVIQPDKFIYRFINLIKFIIQNEKC